MNKNYFKEFYQELNNYKNGVHFLREGTTNREIEKFEKNYSMYLPTTFKEWLLINNGGELFATPVGISIAGILGNGTREKGVFYLEDNFNNKKRIGVPNYIFIFAETCEGNIIGFNLEKTNLKDGVVVGWNHETNELEEEWNSFREWINRELEIGKMFINYDGTEKDIII